MFQLHDIVIWHSFNGDKTVRVLHVYREEPKTLLVTDNLDDEHGQGHCFHAPVRDCTFLRVGNDVTEATRKAARQSEHGTLPLNLIKTTDVVEDV